MTPSQIGVILRDSNGIPQVGSITGSKVRRALLCGQQLPVAALHGHSMSCFC